MQSKVYFMLTSFHLFSLFVLQFLNVPVKKLIRYFVYKILFYITIFFLTLYKIRLKIHKIYNSVPAKMLNKFKRREYFPIFINCLPLSVIICPFCYDITRSFSKSKAKICFLFYTIELLKKLNRGWIVLKKWIGGSSVGNFS